MAEFLPWFQTNWFNAIATVVGIIGVYYTMVSFRHTSEKADREENLTLTQQHQTLWGEVRARPELTRILLNEVDLKANPPTMMENVFLNEVFVHFENGWKLAQKNTVLTLETYTADVCGFFSLPLPHAVWEKSKETHNPKFVRFIDRAIERAGRFLGNSQKTMPDNDKP